MKKARKPKRAKKAAVSCATTAGYIYVPWPKGKPIPKSRGSGKGARS